MDLGRIITWMEPAVDGDFVPPPLDEELVLRALGDAAGPRNVEQHLTLLRHWNGFYALRGLLHVLGGCTTPPNHSLEAWNSLDGWRRAYGMRTEGAVFFAQDAFGDQFGYRQGKVVRLKAQLGVLEGVATSLVEWIESVLVEPDYALSRKLFELCIDAHGPLPHGGLFFVPSMQGPFDAEKVQVMPRRDGMELLAVAAAAGVRRPSAMLRASQKPGS